MIVHSKLWNDSKLLMSNYIRTEFNLPNPSIVRECNMPPLGSNRRSRAVQTTFHSTEKVEELSQSKSGNSRIQQTNYDCNASSRETSSTTDSSYSSRPTSVTSVTQSMQLTAEGGYQHEDVGICVGRWSKKEVCYFCQR